MRHDRSHAAFLVVYFASLASAVTWLLIGLLPALAAGSDSIHDALHRLGTEGGIFAQLAQNAAQTSHTVGPGLQIVLDYLFSAFNLGLAAVFVHLRPRDPAPRLLALGLVGSSIAFNLQGHDALQVIPPAFEGLVGTWHLWVHIGSGLSYLFALLVFPHGALMSNKIPVAFLQAAGLVFLTMILVALSAATAEDHTTGLVILFGIAIPVVGLSAQVVRYVRSRSEQHRQQSRLLILSLIAAGLVAVPSMILTNAFGRTPERQTIGYEVRIGAPGTYYFRCDPHPEDMRGVVEVSDDADAVVEISARKSRFDDNRIALPSDQSATISFTNFDSDLHNVAIYRDPAMNDPIFIGEEFSGRPRGATAFRVFRIVFALIPIALLIELARFRLWDINRVINRTLAYALIASIISIAYLTIVAGLGAIFGVGERLNLVVSIAVTILVAALFQPFRDRAMKLANRIIYGNRATPYELLSEFSNRMGGRYDFQSLIPELARILGEGIGASQAEVWLRVDGELVRAASWPGEVTEPMSVPMDNGSVPKLEGRDRVADVRHGNEVLGALSVTKPAGEQMTPVEQRLLEDAASQAGLAFKNVQLNAELRARLDELQASRSRLVVAQDAERRRLERDIHDGVQQHLVALSMKLRRAQDLAETDPARAQELMAELQTDTGETLQALRDLARGIHPPVLSDHGLVKALEAHARRCPVPVRVEASGIGRYPTDVESAIYFCCLEAIQNAIKHSGAPGVIVALEAGADGVVFRIRDDGRGFAPGETAGTGLQNMSDRLAALSGHITVESSPGAGTTVIGRVPTSTI